MTITDPTPTEHLTALREGILATFNLDELRNFVFDLSINYDDLRGDTISAKVQALLEHQEKRGRTPALLALLKQYRPNEEWDNFLPAQPEAPSPYKGLQFFTEADADLFFGRKQLTDELIDHLRQHRFLAVVGASGSGKSSVVRAGVIPQVKSGVIEEDGLGSDTWKVHIVTPTEHPLQNLAISLTHDSESVTAAITLADDLRQDNRSLDIYVSRLLMGQPNGRILLVVDQFEELFTQCDDLEERRLFVENLVTAVTSGKQGHFLLILTLRADFYAFAVRYESLRPLLETRQKIVGAMSQDELRQAIEGPAQETGWQLQPGLVDTMLQAVGHEPGALPLLSHALQATWDRREGRVMTLAGYHAAGGVRQAIGQTADAVYAGLTPEEQAIARNIFLCLTELGEGTEDTRRRASLAEFWSQGEMVTAVQEVLDLLARKRLVTLNEERAGGDVSQNYAEVAHEALIREWPTLRKWLDEDREGLRIQRQLTAVAKEWQAAGEDTGYLYRGARLAQAMEWVSQHETQLNELEQRFLVGSETAVEQEEREREAQRQRELEAARAMARTERRLATRNLILFLMMALAAVVLSVNPVRMAWLRQQAKGPRDLLVPLGPFAAASLGDNSLFAVRNALPEDDYAIPSFAIERFEVTNERYLYCVHAGECTQPLSTHDASGRPDFPVARVTAVQANEFCQWIGRRLPTELEWEVAARTAEGHRWPWGDSSPNSQEQANFDYKDSQGSLEERLQEVGKANGRPGELPLYDFAGNVWEWTSQPWTNGEQPFNPNEIWDGQMQTLPKQLIIKGGGVGFRANIIESMAFHYGPSPFDVSGNFLIGFRCAVDNQ